MQFDLASALIVVPDQVVSRLVDGSTVLLDLETGHSFALDEVGTRVWQALIECRTARAAVDRLIAEYTGSPDVIEQDLVALLEELASKNLVRLHTPED